MSTLTTKKLVVFIDAQNCYKSARDAFFSRTAPYINGQTDPVKLANINNMFEKHAMDTKSSSRNQDIYWKS